MTRVFVEGVGRGPTRVRAELQPTTLLVVLEGTLTRAERTLVAAGQAGAVEGQRRSLVEIVREELVAAAETAAGRPVRALLHDISPADDVAALTFLFSEAAAPCARRDGASSESRAAHHPARDSRAARDGSASDGPVPAAARRGAAQPRGEIS